MATPLADDDFSELVDFHPDRVDLVKNAANGTRFLIAKSDANVGVLDPEFVRDLISKSEPEPASREVTMPQTTLPNGITLTGSPADMAAFIHKATQEQKARETAADDADVAKAEMSGKAVNDLPDSAFGYIEPGGKKDADGKTVPRSKRHFPLNDAAHVRNALARASQSPFGDKAMPKIRAAAKKFGIEVSKEAGVPDTVAKDAGDALDAALDEGQDGLDPTVPAAAPDGLDSIPGDPADPGSSAWEAVDSATAAKWSTIIAGAKRAVEWLIDREQLEAVTADPDDAGNACDLSSACDALDYAISVLAPFAVSEQSESDRLAFEADVAKGAADPQSVMAAVVAIAKAGRVLSSANESRIRQASQHLNDVLASLPQAPDAGGTAAVTKEEGAMPETQDKADDVAKESVPDATGTPEAAAADVAKDAQEPAPVADAAPEAPVAKSSSVAILYDHAGDLLGVAPSGAVTMRAVRKADADGDGDGGKATMQAVFDENGDLIGICDPADITPVAGAGKKAAAPEDDGTAKPADGDAAKPDAADLEPQPSADAGTPAGAPADDDENVAKAQEPGAEENTPMADVLKSIAQLQKALEDSEAARQEAVVKAAGEQAKEIEALKARLEQVEATPAAPKVFTNGQVPPPRQLRGQDQGAAQIDVAKAMERRKRLYQAPDAAEQNAVAKEMMADAMLQFDAMRSR